MEVSIIGAVISVVVGPLLYLAYKSMSRPANFPPGPLGVPILGSLHLLKEYPERDMLEMAKKYGNIFSLKTATQNYVCVCGTEENREVLFHKDIVDRPATYIFYIIKGNEPRGIVHSNYREWLKANRALMHSILTDTGKVKRSVNEIVDQETTKLMDELEKLDGEPQHIGSIATTSFISTLMSIVFGSKTEQSTEDKNKVDEIAQCMIFLRKAYEDKLFLLPQLIPGLHTIWLPKTAKQIISGSDKFFQYCADQAEIHKKTIKPGEDRDLVDLYLRKMDEEKDMQDTVFTKENFRALVYDIFIGGTETSSKILEFTGLYLAAHPGVQAKIHDEIMEVVGSDGKVKYDDVTKMHYTHATSMEIFRLSTVAPTGISRKARKDVTVGGYSIPKGTIFLMNPYSSNSQGNKWKNPREFDPENFLDEEGKFVHNDAFLAFGGGLRKCVGVQLIKMELFIFLVKIVQKFTIKPETDDLKIDYEPVGGVLRIPKEYKLRFELREKDS